ncbi:HEPN domain-containing protein, partial [Chloroflexota bacterium]
NYIHEITRLGMLEVYVGTRPQTNAFLRSQISMETAMTFTIASGISGFEAEIREKHSYLAFQQPDRVADAIRLFSNIELWSQVAIRLTLPANDVKSKLQLIIDRRNKIAHEADLDPSFPGTRWPISVSDVVSTIDFIDAVCEAIHSLVV